MTDRNGPPSKARVEPVYRCAPLTGWVACCRGPNTKNIGLRVAARNVWTFWYISGPSQTSSKIIYPAPYDIVPHRVGPFRTLPNGVVGSRRSLFRAPRGPFGPLGTFSRGTASFVTCQNWTRSDVLGCLLTSLRQVSASVGSFGLFPDCLACLATGQESTHVVVVQGAGCVVYLGTLGNPGGSRDSRGSSRRSSCGRCGESTGLPWVVGLLGGLSGIYGF